MARIRFLSDQIFENGGPGNGPTFAKGFVLDETGVAEALGLPSVTPEYAEAFLNRWVQRGVAETVDGRAKPTVSPSDEPQSEDIDLSTLTRAQLDALAEERGVDISDAKNKGDVIAALELAAEANG